MAANPMSNSSSERPLIDQERPFELSDIFYSRTDKRGVIQAGNTIFREVSEFAWSELLKAPHKVVRHPDMPRGVFWLMWETIKSGKPMGAYVKNRTADGRYYWVFALATPNDDGYFSVRIKPSAPLLDDVKKVYAELRAAENEGEMTPEQSAKRLLERLAEHGFPDYETFQARALSQLEPSEQRKVWKNFLDSGMEITADNIKQFTAAGRTGKAKPADLTGQISREYMDAVKAMIEQVQLAQNGHWQKTSRQAALLWNRVVREKILSDKGG
jgi:hypothetical protein